MELFSIRALRLLAPLVVATAAWMLVAEGASRAAEPAAKAPGEVRPTPPARYTVPRPFIRVRTSAQLHAALARKVPRRIVLHQGTYDSAGPFLNPNGHAIYAGLLGKAVLTAGLSLGGDDDQPGGLVRGVVFDVHDPAKTADGAAVLVWENAGGSQVLDVTLRGNGTARSGVSVRQPEGFRGERLVVRGFTDYGVRVDANDRDRTTLEKPFRVRDVDVADVTRPVPGSSHGTGEACVWIGNPGIVVRVRARRCAWTGLWTGTATTGGRFDRIDVDETRTGVYIEHFTRQSTFQRVRVGRRVRTGVTAEWADPAWNREPASVENVIQDSRFESWLVGVYLDEGTTRTTIRRSTFVGQRWAAIGDYQGIENTYYANDYRGIAPGAAAVTHAHIRTSGAGTG
jgi:hypothetical protein